MLGHLEPHIIPFAAVQTRQLTLVDGETNSIDRRAVTPRDVKKRDEDLGQLERTRVEVILVAGLHMAIVHSHSPEPSESHQVCSEARLGDLASQCACGQRNERPVPEHVIQIIAPASEGTGSFPPAATRQRGSCVDGE